MRWLAAIGAALLCVAAPTALPAAHWWENGPALPKRTGRVVDEAGLLSPVVRAELSSRLARLEKATGHQLVILTVRSLKGQTIEDFGVRVGRTWGVGRRGVDDGVLLIVAPTERKVRIEVGYGLEKRLSDPLCAKIIRERIAPHFARGDMSGGIVAGTDAIIAGLGNKPG